MLKSRQRKAFSLLELMIVITIMAVLAAASIPSYIKYIQRATLAEAVSILGDYRLALGIFWNVGDKLPATGDVLTGTPADLPFGIDVTTNLPDTIESIKLTGVGNGVLISLVVDANIFSTYPSNNRRIYLGAKISDNRLVFACGNLSTDAAVPTDFGFIDRSVLPKNCNYNGVNDWLLN